MTSLLSCRKEKVELLDALRTLGCAALTGYCITPARFLFARWRNGELDTHGVCAAGDLQQVYEARFFNDEGELRWLRNMEAGDRGGDAAWISETRLPEGWQTCAPVLSGLTPLEDSLRPMTGTLGSILEEGWWEMDAPRHGKVAVPLANGRPRQRLAYKIREYLGPAPGNAGKDGNRIVVEERLLGITAVDWEQKPATSEETRP